MIEQHPITPPPELVKQWSKSGAIDESVVDNWVGIATQAARWGWEQRGAVNEAELQKAKDEELEALLDLADQFLTVKQVRHLRDIRRPKPPSLKEQALDALRDLDQRCPSSPQAVIIRRALQELPD